LIVALALGLILALDLRTAGVEGRFETFGLIVKTCGVEMADGSAEVAGTFHRWELVQVVLPAEWRSLLGTFGIGLAMCLIVALVVPVFRAFIAGWLRRGALGLGRSGWAIGGTVANLATIGRGRIVGGGGWIVLTQGGEGR